MEQLQKSAYSIAPPPTSASPKMTSPRGRLEFPSVSHSRSSINVHGSVIAMPAASADGTGTRIWMCHLQHKRTPPPRNFWTVSQTEPARNTTTRRRFPRAAKSTVNDPVENRPEARNPWQNRRPFLRNHPEVAGGKPADKTAAATTINISLELGRILGQWSSQPPMGPNSPLCALRNPCLAHGPGSRKPGNFLRARSRARAP